MELTTREYKVPLNGSSVRQKDQTLTAMRVTWSDGLPGETFTLARLISLDLEAGTALVEITAPDHTLVEAAIKRMNTSHKYEITDAVV